MSKKKYAPRFPRAGNGFRAQDIRVVPRGAWWVKRWLQAIEGMHLGARAGRGKFYAEQGQVTSLCVNGTHVEASVLGVRPDPYAVKIDFAPAVSSDGYESSAAFCERLGAMSIGRILAGEMPTLVDELFSVKGLSLYPTLGVDQFWCSCPDWSKPCKHIAAVLYLLGDVLVREPMLLLRLRGITLMQDIGADDMVLPLWSGKEKFADFLERIYRRTDV